MSAFCLSRHKLDEMFFYMIKEMRVGLKSVEEGKSTLRMLTSFVKRKETNSCSGLFYAVDLGGTNLRIIKLVLQNGKIVQKCHVACSGSAREAQVRFCRGAVSVCR